MARLIFPDEGSRLVYRVSGTDLVLAPGVNAVMYTDSGTTTTADLRVYDGTPTPGAAIPGASLTLDAYSRLPLFWGPDAVDTLYTVISGGPVAPVYARFDDRIDAIIAGGGGGSPPAMTLAALDALRSGGTLSPGVTYLVNDWTLANLPGPNLLAFTALAVDQLAGDVHISTPLGDNGPQRGIYSFDLGAMNYIEDGLGNQLTGFSGTLLEDFPFGDTNWTSNVINGVGSSLTGAITAAAAGVKFNNNVLRAGQVDFTGHLTGEIRHCAILNGSVLVTGADFTALSATFNAATTLSQAPGCGGVSVYACSFIDTTFAVTTSPNLTDITDCDFITLFYDESASTVAGSTWQNCVVRNTGVTLAITAGNTSALFQNCHFENATVNYDQAVAPFSGNGVFSTWVTGGSTLDITNDSGAYPAVDHTVVENQSTLNVQGGKVDNSRVSTGATFNTGAFVHASVIIDGALTKTATANNTNTYAGFGADTIV